MPPRLPSLPEQIALRGTTDPRMIAFAGDPRFTVQAPEEPKAAPFADRLANLLVPNQYAGILDPETSRQIGRRGLLDFGLNLLQAGGRSPLQRGTLANIGASLQNLDIPGAVQSAIRMRAVVDELNQRSSARDALKEIAKRHPMLPGASREDKYNQLVDMVTEASGVPGLEDWVGKMSNVLAQTRPQKQGRLIRSIERDETTGRPMVVFRDAESGEVVKEGGEAQGLTEYQIQQLQLQRAAADRADSNELKDAALGANMAASHLAMKAIEDADPQAVEEVSTLVRSGRVAAATPVAGPLLDEAIRAGKAPVLSPAARQLLANLNSFVAAAVPGRGGQALTFIEVKLFMDEFVRDPGDDPATAAVKVENRLRRIKEQKIRGRRAWEDALKVNNLTDEQIFGVPPSATPKHKATGWRALNPEAKP